MGRTQASVGKFSGLYLQANSFSEVPDGSFETAQNVVFSSDGVIRKRRGFESLGDQTLNPNSRSIVQYNRSLCTLTSGKLQEYSYLLNSGQPDSYTPSTLVYNNNIPVRWSQTDLLYFTADGGVRKYQSFDLPRPVGLPRPLDLEVTLGVAGVSTATSPPDSQCGWQILYGQKILNSLTIGAPSQLAIAINRMISATCSFSSSGTSHTVTVTAAAGHNLSAGITTVKIGTPNGTNGPIPGSFQATYINATQFSFVYTSTSAPVGLTTIQYGIFRKPTLEFTLPAAIDSASGYFYRIYRTTSSVGADATPQLDAQLVYEGVVTNAQVAAKTITYTDETPEVLKGTDLYTNPNQEGAARGNLAPPVCYDIALFAGSMFYANAIRPASSFINLVDVSTANFVIGDSFIITETSNQGFSIPERYYTAAAVASYNSGFGGSFKLTNASGSVSVAAAIDATARSLCQTINRDPLASVYAFYQTGTNGVPGQIYLERKVSDGGTPYFQLSASSARTAANFNPALASVTNRPEIQKNYLYFSKTAEAEAVPLPYFLLVGPKTAAILRIVPLRDSLIVLSEAGVYRVTGNNPTNFNVTVLDSTVVCHAKESVVTLNNQVFFLSKKGFVAVNESGVSVISRQIEPAVSTLLRIDSVAIDATGGSVGYESENLYMYSPSGTVAYTYNYVTNAWSTSDFTFVSGLVSTTNDLLFLQVNTDTRNRLRGIVKERKTGSETDYSDRSRTIGIIPGGDGAYKVKLTGTDIRLNDIVVFTSGAYKIIGYDATTSIATLSSPVHTTDSSGTLYTQIPSTLKTAPFTAGDASVMKHVPELQVNFRGDNASQLTFSFSTESSGESQAITWSGRRTDQGWGGTGWGSFAWGGENSSSEFTTGQSKAARVLLPRNSSRCQFVQVQIDHSVAGEALEIQALTWTVRGYSNRTSR